MTLTQDTSTDTPESPRPRHSRRAVVGAAAAAALLAGGIGLAVGTRLDEASGDPAADPAPAPAPAPAEDDAPAAVPATGPLSWAPPELEDPEVVTITSEDTDLKLDQDRDYELVMPDEPLGRGLTVFGGRNVVLIGGEIQIEGGEGEGSRGLYLRDQTGTIHVEGLRLTGSSLNEGINLDQREGAVVQLQNIRVDGVEGSREGHHADLLQSWAGPSQLLIDGLSGTTGYQGFFLLPQQFGDQPEPELFDLRRIDIQGAESGSAYLLWRDDESWPLETSDVWVSPTDVDPDERRDFLWDREGDDSWADVSVGSPPEGEFVPEGLAGVDYVSPGYGASG